MSVQLVWDNGAEISLPPRYWSFFYAWLKPVNGKEPAPYPRKACQPVTGTETTSPAMASG